MAPRPDRAPPLRLDELAVFVEVATAGSLAAAARRLGVPKSTVGRAVARLEAGLGAALVRRTGAGPALTAAGQTLVTQAAPHVAALRDVASALAGAATEIHGTLRITAPTDLAQVVLGPLVAAFVARHPQLAIEVDCSIRVVDLAAEGLDLAVRVARRALPPSALVARKLARLDLGLYASPTYLARRGAPRRPADLDDHDHVLLTGRQGRAQLTLDGPGGPTRATVRGRTSGNDFFFMRELTLAGAGIGPLSWFLARADVAAGRLVRVLPDHRLAGTTAYVVHLPLRPLPAKVVAFKRFLLEHAPPLLIEPA
ncbi:MAG: LysR family transcriptional regulator [Kofleriaceae bacterium]